MTAQLIGPGGSVKVVDSDGDELQVNPDGSINVGAVIVGVIDLEGDDADLDTTAAVDDHDVVAIGLPAPGGHVVGGTAANPFATAEQNVLIPERFDYIALSYTGADLTTVEYRQGGPAGTPVATLSLVYASGVLQTVTRS